MIPLKKVFSKDFLTALVIRAIWTMAEVALSMITVGAAISEISWVHIVSVAVVAGVGSILKSIVVGLPEVAPDIDFPDPMIK